jgi:hypothetical protein
MIGCGPAPRAHLQMRRCSKKAVFDDFCAVQKSEQIRLYADERYLRADERYLPKARAFE